MHSLKYFYLLLLLLAGSYACKPDWGKKRPNIIFIMSDDHASKAISAYDTSLIMTPNIDRMAERGIRFDNCFCTNAICAPSRAVILTGKYSHMNGVVDNLRPFDNDEWTLPEMLRESGYQTALVGKWHLKNDPKGFDQWLVLPGQGQYYKPDFVGPEGRISIDGYVTDIITDKAIAFIDSMSVDKPFFIMVHHKAPHRSWQPAIRHIDRFDGKAFPIPENLHDTYRGKSASSLEQRMTIAKHMALDYDLKVPDSAIHKKVSDRELFFNSKWDDPKSKMSDNDYGIWSSYYGKRAAEYDLLANDTVVIDEWKYHQYLEDYLSCISTIDENIGRLLDHLDQNGLAENTIVIYTSDQGFFLGEHGWYDKRFMYEEAHRMPLIMQLPGQKPLVDRHMITNADFAPTILELAGAKVPGDMQGVSFLRLLERRKLHDWRNSVYYHYFEFPDQHNVRRHYGIRTERFKLIHYYYDIDEWELFDLESDPHEMNNLCGNESYADTLAGLKKELENLRIYYQDTDTERFLPVLQEAITGLAVGKTYTLAYPPAETYPDSLNSLTDGISYPEGDAYYTDYDEWCGFEKEDFIIDIDLEEIRSVSEISTGFLQNQNSWIFLPGKVEFYVSTDGIEYLKIHSEQNDSIVKDPHILIRNYHAPVQGLNARFVRVHARNNVLPLWHQASGEGGWLFVDEVVVK